MKKRYKIFLLYLYTVWQINKIEYERGGRHQHLIQENLEMYSILKGMQYTSPVPKIIIVTTLNLVLLFDTYLRYMYKSNRFNVL